MGGQACVLYGAAEFSRDSDFVILADEPNLERLRNALEELRAEVIAVPPFEAKHLRRGHAVHFRCAHPEAAGVRIDVMSRLRGVDSFSRLWRRRTSLELPDGLTVDILSLPDLVLAKKTQRDKDWPMLRRLVERHYFEHRGSPTASRVRFWLRELRTPELLVETARHHPDRCRELSEDRPLLTLAAAGRASALAAALAEEEAVERKRDREYWTPLRSELEELRRRRR
jgi:hypothetical protein